MPPRRPYRIRINRNARSVESKENDRAYHERGRIAMYTARGYYPRSHAARLEANIALAAEDEDLALAAVDDDLALADHDIEHDVP